MQNLIIRKAATNDLLSIEHLLQSSKLPVEGIPKHLQNFLIAEMNEKIVGTIGLEIYQQTGLLRSAVTATDLQNRGIGSRLVNMIIDYAKEQNVKELILLTETAKDYFARKGFMPIDQQTVKGNIRSSVEFQGACPSTAICMRKTL